MNTRRIAFSLLAGFLAGALPAGADNYTDPPAPALGQTLTNGQKRITYPPYPAADVVRMLKTTNFTEGWSPDASGTFSNATWAAPALPNVFHKLEVTSLSSNAVLAASALSKVGYGPTPELLDRLLQGTGTNTAAAWIAEQLAPETITERAALAHTNIAFIESRFGTPTNYIIANQNIKSGAGSGDLVDLQAWLVLNAVFADRQLLETLTQFWENHFVTYAGKDANFFVGAQFGNSYPTRAAAEWEWREMTQWRTAMLRTNWTFHDMLKISAESCAMINYLDTATSRANPPNIANENYSRELQELFTMGVDNGYDQSDITNMAPAWAGWTFELVLSGDAGNPFAVRSTVKLDPSGNNAFTNLLGVWAMNFKTGNHGTGAKTIYGGKMVPARFGPPYTTKTYGGNVTPGLYQLNIPARTGTNGFRDGYDIIAHLANLPFTQEYISVKLCRLLVHDGFQHGIYDYNSPALSEEGKLVKACMAAWEANNGQMRPVLATILNSALFRGAGGNSHKVKTPLEFAVSAIRTIRQSTNGTGNHGTWTATTDGYGIASGPGQANRAFQSGALNRMGGMVLFNREAPDGYPEAGSGWVDAGSMAERVRFVSSALKAVGQPFKDDQNSSLTNNVTDPVRLLMLRLPSGTDQRDATKVAGLFLDLLFPGEGRANLDYYKQVAIAYLDSADNGATSSPFSLLTPNNAAGNIYDTRIRGMVAMLMSLQRFQEQ
jgi:uncharacterized protein (DUF1800 family)